MKTIRFEDLLIALRNCGKGIGLTERCWKCGYYDNKYCSADLCNDAANAIESLRKEIERLREASHNWELFEMANLKAWRETFEECYGENGTQRWDKNPDIKVFKDEG